MIKTLKTLALALAAGAAFQCFALDRIYVNVGPYLLDGVVTSVDATNYVCNTKPGGLLANIVSNGNYQNPNTVATAQAWAPTGYQLKRWYVVPQGTDVTAVTEATVTFGGYSPINISWQSAFAQDVVNWYAVPSFEMLSYTLYYNSASEKVGSGDVNLDGTAHPYTNEVTVAALPEEWKNPGYEITGWALEQEATEGEKLFAPGDVVTGADFPTATNGEVRLYARWAVRDIEIALDPQGGTVEPASVTVRIDESYDLPVPERYGYSFEGWFTTAGEGGQIIESGDLVDRDDIATLYAHWAKLEMRTVTFSFRNARGGATNETQQVVVGADAVPPAASAYDCWPGRRFVKWDTDFRDVSDDLTVTAVYAIYRHTVAFDANGGTGTMSAQTFTYGLEQPLATNAFTRVGYGFVGWSTKKDAAVAEFTDGQAVKDLSLEDQATVTLYAVWMRLPAVLQFRANGGTGTMVSLDSFVGDVVSLPECAFTRTGYAFAGWSMSATGALAYLDGATITLSSTLQTNVLYAAWSAKEYAVRFSANGGSGKMDAATFAYDQVGTLPKNTFTRGSGNAFTFLGWSTDPAATTPELSDGATIKNLTTEGSVRLYAIWRNNLGDLSRAANSDCALGTRTLYADAWSADASVGAVRSGKVTNAAGSSVLTNAVSGAGTLSFRWKANVATTYRADAAEGFRFMFKTNETGFVYTTLEKVPPKDAWETVTVKIDNAGLTMFQWVSYYNAANPSAAVWVTDIVWTPAVADRYAEYDVFAPTYTGAAQQGVAPVVGCTFTGVTSATKAGTYTAKGTLAAGYRWDDESETPRTVTWTIAKARYNLGSVSFTNATFVADGKTKSLEISGKLPAGVSVSYVGNGQTAAGTYVVTAKFTGDAVNYEPIKDRTATLRILGGDEKPDDDPEPGDDDPPSGGEDEPNPGDDEPGDDDPPGPDEPDDPEPEPEDLPTVLYPSGDVGAFTASAAATYIGWLRGTDGRLAGALTVKTGKARPGATSRVTITTTLLGERKMSYRTNVLPAAETRDEYGIVYGNLGLRGSFGGYEVIAGKDFTKSRDAAEKALVNEMPQGVWTLAFESSAGTSAFSLTVSRKGKAKLTGTLANGTKVSVSTQGVLGEDGLFAVPIAYSKSGRTLGFVVWIDAAGQACVTDCADATWTKGVVAAYTAPSAGSYSVVCTMPAWRNYLTTLDGFDLTPSGVAVTLNNGRLSVPRTVGSVKYNRTTGAPYVAYNAARQTPANLAALKLTLTAKTGVLKGSCKLYYLDGARVKSDSVTISGIVVGKEIIASGQVRNQGSFAIRLK